MIVAVADLSGLELMVVLIVLVVAATVTSWLLAGDRRRIRRLGFFVDRERPREPDDDEDTWVGRGP